MNKILLIIILFISMLTGCSLNNNEMIFILHAGGGLDGMIYLNCQEAFYKYYEMGYRYFEYDLKLSVDGRIIASHEDEYFNGNTYEMTYEEFKNSKINNEYNPVYEEWLFEILNKYNDVIIIVDSKMETEEDDVNLLTYFWNLQEEYDCDIKDRIIPEIFSKEMWEIVKKTTGFSKNIYSQYKKYYTVDQMLKYFADDRIYGIAVSTYIDSDIKSNLHKVKLCGKKMYFNTLFHSLHI